MSNTIVQSYMPSIIYLLVASSKTSDIRLALLVATLTLLGSSYRELRNGSISSWAQLVLFVSIFLLMFVFHHHWTIEHVTLWTGKIQHFFAQLFNSVLGSV